MTALPPHEAWSEADTEGLARARALAAALEARKEAKDGNV